MATYDKNELVRCRGVFMDELETIYVDPTIVKFDYRLSSASTTTLTYGTDAAVVKESTGHYYVDVDASSSGVWFYRFYAPNTSTYQASEEQSFTVEPSQF